MGATDRSASGVIAHLQTFVDGLGGFSTKGGKLRSSRYRLALLDEPDTGIEGRFYVDMRAMRVTQAFGAGENWRIADATIQVGYVVQGGRENAITVAMRAADDMQRLADLVENPVWYDQDKTGIRKVFDVKAARITVDGHREIWGLALSVEWAAPIIVV